MSLALLAPSSSVPGASASWVPSSSPPGAEDGVSGSVGVLAGMSPGWDRAELQQNQDELSVGDERK